MKRNFISYQDELINNYKNNGAYRLSKYMRRLSLSFLLLFIQSTELHANFPRAMEIYNEQRYEEAKAAFEALSAIGDRSALFNLGVMYYRGEAVEKNPKKGYVLMTMANKGLNDEQFSTITAKIYASFNEKQQKQVEALTRELKEKYDITEIRKQIYPQPLEDKDCAKSPVPLERISPIYPVAEQRKGRMGLTKFEYTISPQGYVRDIYLGSSTSKYFTKSSLKAVKRFRYEVSEKNEPVYGHRMVFTYQLVGNGPTKVRTKEIKEHLEEIKIKAMKGNPVAQYEYGVKLNSYRYFSNLLEDIDLQYREANKWFLESANKGVVNAQFEIGRNMIEGRGCKIDESNGIKWINAAATSGYSPAQNMLAQNILDGQDIGEAKDNAAISWLRNASLTGDYYPAKLLLAWELSSSKTESLRNGSEALQILDEEPVRYYDDVRLLETKAAAYAEIDNFNKAVKYQKKAIKAASKQDWEIPIMSERLGLYEHKQAWTGSYY